MCHVWNKYISEVFFDLCSGINTCTVGIAGFHCQKSSHKLSADSFAVVAADTDDDHNDICFLGI